MPKTYRHHDQSTSGTRITIKSSSRCYTIDSRELGSYGTRSSNSRPEVTSSALSRRFPPTDNIEVTSWLSDTSNSRGHWRDNLTTREPSRFVGYPPTLLGGSSRTAASYYTRPSGPHHGTHRSLESLVSPDDSVSNYGATRSSRPRRSYEHEYRSRYRTSSVPSGLLHRLGEERQRMASVSFDLESATNSSLRTLNSGYRPSEREEIRAHRKALSKAVHHLEAEVGKRTVVPVRNRRSSWVV